MENEFKSNMVKVVVCPICEQQFNMRNAVVYLLEASTFTDSEPYLCYCKSCHHKYQVKDTITHMGNTYRRII